MQGQCNNTLEQEMVSEMPIWKGHGFHGILKWSSAMFALLATVLSLAQIMWHANVYSRPQEQKHIIRIHFIIPIYTISSWLGLDYYRHYTYFQFIRDGYAAFAVASFFNLLISYVSLNGDYEKISLSKIRPKPWQSSLTLPIGLFRRCCGGERGPWRTPRDPVTWYNILWCGVYQYCFVLLVMSVAAIVAQLCDRYCIESTHPAFLHIWALVFDAVAAAIASYCLDQFHYQIKNEIRERRSTFQIWCIKGVLFMSLYQSLLLSLLLDSGAVRPSYYIQIPDLKVGLPMSILCLELSIISALHMFAYPAKLYRYSASNDSYQLHNTLQDGTYAAFVPPVPFTSDLDDLHLGELAPKGFYKGGFLGIRALGDAFNPWDFVIGCYNGFKWLLFGRRKQIPHECGNTYQNISEQEQVQKNHLSHLTEI